MHDHTVLMTCVRYLVPDCRDSTWVSDFLVEIDAVFGIWPRREVEFKLRIDQKANSNVSNKVL